MKQPILLPKFGPNAGSSAEVDRPESIPGPELGQNDIQLANDQPLTSQRAARSGRLQNFLRQRGGEKTGKDFVQAELALEAVRVVRNDLNDDAAKSDLPLAQIKAKDKQREGRAQPWWKRLRLVARRRKQD